MVVEEKVATSGALLSLMTDTGKSEGKLTTLHDIKESLEEYSLSKLRSLSYVLIDSLNNLVKDKRGLKEV